MNNKIFITGEKGFIGSNLIRRLEANEIKDQHSLTKSKKLILNHAYIDVNNKKKWNKSLKDIDCIIHCGARAHIINEIEDNPLEIFRKSNTETTISLAQEAVKFGVKRMIFLSTIGVNGIFTEIPKKFTFKDPPSPIEPYAISKWEAEQKLLKLSKQTGLELVIIRAPLVYGQGVKGNFARLIKLVKNGIPLPFSLVRNKRSLIGIDNLIDVIIKCIDHPDAKFNTFLVSDGEDMSTPDLIRYISLAMGRSARLFPMPIYILKFIGRVLRKQYEIDRLLGSLQLDISYTREILNWTPKISVAEGIRRMVDEK